MLFESSVSMVNVFLQWKGLWHLKCGSIKIPINAEFSDYFLKNTNFTQSRVEFLFRKLRFFTLGISWYDDLYCFFVSCTEDRRSITTLLSNSEEGITLIFWSPREMWLFFDASELEEANANYSPWSAKTWIFLYSSWLPVTDSSTCCQLTEPTICKLGCVFDSGIRFETWVSAIWQVSKMGLDNRKTSRMDWIPNSKTENSLL